MGRGAARQVPRCRLGRPVRFDPVADAPRHHFWTEFTRQNGLAGLDVERGMVFDTAVLAAQYALGGQGIAVLDTNLFAEEIRAGRLVKPFEATLDDGYGYYLTTQP
ncbi:MAG: hypothetical protein KGK18_02995, partial [Burkholderiales bacterium]|nr:hypothetical protein [Burkholderiales bacterium]